MEISEIENFLEKNGLSEIEEIKNDENYSVIKFYYDFDKDELSAARAYANEESDLESESAEWYTDWYLSYLSDLAKDNVEEIIEELSEEFEVITACKDLEMTAKSADYMKFIAIITNEEIDDIDDMLMEYIE
ncbi:MAG: hypothetical protein SOY42_02775 [Clostridium sp.]|nr:hypothetical protein [Clostridium sp.]